jgi:hypothetical protein
MTKKTAPDTVNFAELNDTELRQQCEKRTDGYFVSPWTPREKLLAFLEKGEPLPENPLNKVRFHQVCAILNKFKFYGPMLPCSGNCYEHNDIEVLECQVQNPALRHPDYPTDETRINNPGEPNETDQEAS